MTGYEIFYSLFWYLRLARRFIFDVTFPSLLVVLQQHRFQSYSTHQQKYFNNKYTNKN